MPIPGRIFTSERESRESCIDDCGRIRDRTPDRSGSAARHRRKGPGLQILHSRGQDYPALRGRSKRSRCLSRCSRLSWLPTPLLQPGRLCGGRNSRRLGLSRSAQDLGAKANEFLADKKLPENFDLVLHPGYEFTNMYGFRWDAPHETAYPSTFLIDRQGVIFFCKIVKEHGGRTTAAEILDAIFPRLILLLPTLALRTEADTWSFDAVLSRRRASKIRD
jgi:hypothetical protein